MRRRFVIIRLLHTLWRSLLPHQTPQGETNHMPAGALIHQWRCSKGRMLRFKIGGESWVNADWPVPLQENALWAWQGRPIDLVGSWSTSLFSAKIITLLATRLQIFIQSFYCTVHSAVFWSHLLRSAELQVVDKITETNATWKMIQFSSHFNICR